MIGGRRLVRRSERAIRASFAGYRPIDLAHSGFMTARRRAEGRLRSRMPSQLRAFQALNCFGVRIWAHKPVIFKGREWRARRATIMRCVG